MHPHSVNPLGRLPKPFVYWLINSCYSHVIGAVMLNTDSVQASDDSRSATALPFMEVEYNGDPGAGLPLCSTLISLLGTTALLWSNTSTGLRYGITEHHLLCLGKSFYLRSRIIMVHHIKLHLIFQYNSIFLKSKLCPFATFIIKT